MSEDRYLQTTYLARYLETEWGDFLLRYGNFPNRHSRPFAFQPDGVEFYTSVVSLIRGKVAANGDFKIRRIGDFGSATGRLIRELCHAFPLAEEFHGFEPSALLCGLATQLLTGSNLPDRLPTVDMPLGTFLDIEVTDSLRSALQPTSGIGRVQFTVATAESATISPDYFDLVTCLNVLDRHPDPMRLVQRLGEIVSPGGLLCVSSPLEWQEESTQRLHWCDNVTDFLNDEDYDVLAVEDIDYRFRLTCRRRIHYSSQVVLAKRKR